MENLTYRELFDLIGKMSEEQLNANVTVRIAEQDEFFPVEELKYSPVTDVLDKDHPYLEI